MRQAPGKAKKSRDRAGLQSARCRAKPGTNRRAKTVMPIEPSGTSPISTLPPDKRSVSSAPTPMPIENAASRNVTTASLPPSTSRAKGAKLVRKIEPKNHNHEIPRIELKTVRSWCAIFRLAHVSEKAFQLTCSVASAAGECGINCAAARPAIASSRPPPPPPPSRRRLRMRRSTCPPRSCRARSR